jgi:hypothetical protein
VEVKTKVASDDGPVFGGGGRSIVPGRTSCRMEDEALAENVEFFIAFPGASFVVVVDSEGDVQSEAVCQKAGSRPMESPYRNGSSRHDFGIAFHTASDTLASLPLLHIYPC